MRSLLKGVVLFVLLPILWERRLTRLLLRQRDLPAAEGVRRMVAMRLQVACGEGAVEIRSLQAEGGKRMAAPDYFRGHPLEI